MIKIDHLSKKYNDNVVLDDISLEIKQGDVVGIIGPSGTGKSTLLRCVNRLETPEKGTVTIGDKVIDLSERKPKELLYLRQNTGMVFQRFNLFEKKTALENVMEGLIVVKKMKKDEARAIALEELKLVGMEKWANHYPKHMSGGQQQRVAIASLARPADARFERQGEGARAAGAGPVRQTRQPAARRADLSP